MSRAASADARQSGAPTGRSTALALGALAVAAFLVGLGLGLVAGLLRARPGTGYRPPGTS